MLYSAAGLYRSPHEVEDMFSLKVFRLPENLINYLKELKEKNSFTLYDMRNFSLPSKENLLSKQNNMF